MSNLFPPLAPADAPPSLDAYLKQGKYWRSYELGWLKIKDLSADDRYRAADSLWRGATRMVSRLEIVQLAIFADAPDDVFDSFMAEANARRADPQTWIINTPLYRALIGTDKTKKQVKREALIAQGRCEAIAAMREALANWIDGAKENHDHGDHGDACADHFHVVDIKDMIDQAAQVLGVLDETA